MDRPFDDLNYRKHCETEVEQHFKNKLLSFSEAQFDALSQPDIIRYQQGQRLTISAVFLIAIALVLVTL